MAAPSYYLQTQCSESHFPAYPVLNVKPPASQTPATTFSKTMPHDANGRPLVADLALFHKASGTMTVADWNHVPQGGSAQFVDCVCVALPTLVGADGMALISYDTAQLNQKPVVPGSTYAANCMMELYALMLTRDVPYSFFYERSSEPHALLDALVEELSAMSNAAAYFPSNAQTHVLTRRELFRGRSVGDMQGPFVSQFMLWDIPTFETMVPQKYQFPAAGTDYMRTLSTYLAVANGTGQEPRQPFAPSLRYIVDGRDFAQIVHGDFCFEAYFHAAKIMTTIPGAFTLPQSPYSQAGQRFNAFVNLAPADVMTTLAQGCHVALMGAWKHKWWNLQQRPEELAKEVELWRLTGQNAAGISSELLSSSLLQRVIATNGNALLWQCFPEGCPAHPSWPAAHATVAACCSTILKAYTNPTVRMPKMVVAHESGQFLVPINVADYGEAQNPLVIDEIDKLASNITFARNSAGVHFRSDCEFGLYLGERLAVEYLKDKVQSYKQDGFVFSLNVRLRDGTLVEIAPQ